MRIMASNFGEGCAFHHQLHDSVYKVSEHIHQYAELIFVLEGETRITVDGVQERLCAGDAAFIFPFQIHSFKSREVNRIAMYLFSPAAMMDMFSSREGTVGVRSGFIPSQTTLSVLNERIIGIDEPKIYDIKAFLYLALGDYLEKTPLRNSITGTSVVSKVIIYLNDHFKEDVSLTGVARDLGYSANYLSHCIKRLYGMNFCSVLASLRIEAARKLLTSSNKSLTEISYECGFGSERSFLRQFKSNTGFTPSEFKRRFYVGKRPSPKVVYWENNR